MHALKHPIRFLSIFALALSAVLLGSGGTAAAANPLLCFDGTTDTANGDTGTDVYGGICTLSPDGNSAVLNNAVTGRDGSYSGVYYATSSLSGMALSDVTALGFDYTGTPTAGSPRISLPVDSDGDGDFDFYAFIAAFYCNDAAGHVDAINDDTCTIWVGTLSYANWDAFVAAYPHATVDDSIPFVVADDPGTWTVSNVELGQGRGAHDAKARDNCKNGGWENLTRYDDSEFKNQGDCIQYVNTGK